MMLTPAPAVRVSLLGLAALFLAGNQSHGSPGQQGMVAWCQNGAEISARGATIRDCSPLPDASIAALYARLTSIEYHTYRSLNSLVVVHQGSKESWRFATKGSALTMVTRYSAPTLDGQHERVPVALYCADLGAAVCAQVARNVLNDYPPAVPEFPLHPNHGSVRRNAPQENLAGCVTAPSCLDPEAAPLAYPPESFAECGSGTLTVVAYVDDKGCVCDAAAEVSSRNRELDRAAVDAVERWKLPAASTLVRVPVSFEHDICARLSAVPASQPGASTTLQSDRALPGETNWGRFSVTPRTGRPPASSAVDQYAKAVQRAIESKWARPPGTMSADSQCTLAVTQLPGGEVLDVSIEPECNFDEAGRRTIEAAVLKAQPLPYDGYEAVFHRRLILHFRPGAGTPDAR